MSELQYLLAGELQRRTSAAPEPGPEAMSSAFGAIRRRRRVRAGVAIAASVVGIALMSGAGWAAVSLLDESPEPVGVPTTSPSPTATANVSPSPTVAAEPEPTPEPAVEPALLAREGGAPAATIGDQNWAEGLTLPAPLATPLTSVAGVRQMEPWVWEHVGAGWSLTVVHEGATGAEDIGDQRLLLLAPDGQAFEVWDLRDDRALSVEHWRTDSLIVWLLTDIGADTWSSIALDLRTGERVHAWGDAGAALGHAYIGTLPDGNDLWKLWSTKYAVADIIRVDADATATYATGYDILESTMTKAWTDANAGWSVLAVGGTETPWEAMPVGELTWYRLDHATWQLTTIPAPRYGTLATITDCGFDQVSGYRVAVKPGVSAPNSECVWLDLGGRAEPAAVAAGDEVAAMPSSTVRIGVTGLGLGEGSPSATMLVEPGLP